MILSSETQKQHKKENEMAGIGQHIEYAQNYIAQIDSQQARNMAQESGLSAEKANRNIERLYMVVQAMWELLAEKTGLTHADLDAKVKEIDLRDGRLDGKDSTQTIPCVCKQCGRTILSGLTSCTWCGAIIDDNAFRHSR